ncbi:MAG TPA: methyltransferase domain-containing protein [Gaiellaceae bacterium]|nr:methyltransferase domain-containing protein [Gaiellaceae bacterium]
MTAEPIRVSPDWLDLRESADAGARARELVTHLSAPAVIHDLACGSGAMGRWLAPLLPGPQRWVLHDRDADLLALAAASPPANATVETRLSDVTRLERDALAGADLVTASALLDLFTWDELSAVIASCVRAGCPVLLTLSVTGHVDLTPSDRLDARISDAFNAHQRRRTPRGRLLGPDAVEAAVDAFGRLGREVVVRPSPWRLGTGDAALIGEWLTGWLAAACEQEPELEAEIDLYRRRRLKEAAAGRLAVTVGHADLLVLP